VLRTVQPRRLACDLLATSGRHRSPAADRTPSMEFDPRLMAVSGLRPDPGRSGLRVPSRPATSEAVQTCPSVSRSIRRGVLHLDRAR